MKKTLLINKEYYHIYNRGVDKRNVYLDENDARRFVESLVVFNNKNNLDGQRFDSQLVEAKASDRLVNIVAYCLMPNHFHLLLEQTAEDGITKFIQKMLTSYTMYFNRRHERSGVLFQGVFKRSHIKTNQKLVDLSRYIHANPSKLCSDKSKQGQYVLEYKWSSLQSYVFDKSQIVNTNNSIILDQFKSKVEYLNFVVGET